jgi:hypothetical protein
MSSPPLILYFLHTFIKAEYPYFFKFNASSPQKCTDLSVTVARRVQAWQKKYVRLCPAILLAHLRELFWLSEL